MGAAGDGDSEREKKGKRIGLGLALGALAFCFCFVGFHRCLESCGDARCLLGIGHSVHL